MNHLISNAEKVRENDNDDIVFVTDWSVPACPAEASSCKQHVHDYMTISWEVSPHPGVIKSFQTDQRRVWNLSKLCEELPQNYMSKSSKFQTRLNGL